MKHDEMKQEPVAYDVRCDNCGGDGYDPKDNNYFCSSCESAGFLEKLFYTHPQPKQEPVIGVEVKRIASGGFIGNVWWIHENLQEGVFHLYTHQQPKREPLTDEQIAEFFGVKAVDESFVDFVRAIEAAHGIKEKNT